MNLQLKIDATGDMRNSRKRDGQSEILGLLDLKEKFKLFDRFQDFDFVITVSIKKSIKNVIKQ